MKAIRDLIDNYNESSEETSSERVNERFSHTIRDVNSKLKNPDVLDVRCYTLREAIDGQTGNLTPVVGKDGVLNPPEGLKVITLSNSAGNYARDVGVETNLENFAVKISVDGQKYLAMEGITKKAVGMGRMGYLSGIASLEDDKSEWDCLGSFFGKDEYRFLPIEDAPYGMRDMTEKEKSEMDLQAFSYNVAFPEGTKIEFGPYNMILDKIGLKEAKIGRSEYQSA